MRKKVTDYLLYRWRYVLGYSIFGLGVALLLAVAGFMIPGGLSQSEMNSTVSSMSLNFSSFEPESIINLPYRLLQYASISLLGVTTIGIKLPSLILAVISAIGMLLLLKSWYRPNVAVLTTILVVTTGQFLFVSQSGTPGIMYILLSVWLLVAALRVSRRVKRSGLWKIVLFSVAALSLYTPLSVYILLALASAIILHPHLRYLMRRVLKARRKVTIAILCALVLLAPLFYALYLQPSLAFRLLGVPDVAPDISANIMQLLKQYFDFFAPSSGALMKPVYGLGPILLILLGLVRLFTTKYTARSYIISAWIILLIPPLILSPSFTSVTFVPAMLLMAMGIHSLLHSWYRLFPKNPYARLAGLAPLVVLIGGMMVSGVGRYMYGYLYDPNIAGNFTQDVRIIDKQLTSIERSPVTLLVTEKQEQFLSLVVRDQDNVTVVTKQPSETPSYLLVTRSAKHSPDNSLPRPTSVVTDASLKESDRFYIYTNQPE